jgi:formate-dependent nitrite reductase cytochrome c552 subunit
VKKYFIITGMVIGLACLFALGSTMPQASAQNLPKVREFRIERSMPKQAVACLECHKQENPGIFADWSHSRHASANVTCYDCHKAETSDTNSTSGVI